MLSSLREAVNQLSGSSVLGAVRYADFLEMLKDNIGRVPIPQQPGGGGGGGATDERINQIVEQYIRDIQKLISQAQVDIQGIYREIRVNDALAHTLHGLTLENLGEITDHADELEEHANDLADHALELLDLATSIDAIEADFYDPATGLLATSTLLDATVVRVDSAEDSIDIITAQITALESELIDTTALDPGIMWQFENASDGFTSNVTLTNNSFFIRIAAGASAYFRSPTGIAIDGRLFTRVVARIRRSSGTGWLGRASYATTGGGGHGIDTTNFHLTLATEPNLAGGGWAIVTWDMEILTAGGADWTSNTIDRIQLELSDDDSTVFDVDWIAIGRIAPSYVTSTVNALEARVTATEDSITALSSQVTALETQVDDVAGDVDANATAIDTLDTRITVAEGDIDASAAAITSLDLRLDDAEADITTQASALSALSTRMTSAEGVNTTQASQITSLNTSVSSLNGTVSGQGSALTALTSRVTTAEGTISTHTSQITSLQADVNDPVNGLDALATVVNTFDARITSAEDTVDSLSFTVTALQSEVNALDSEVGGFASAISTLNTRVTTVESNVTSQASAIQLLQVRGGGVEANRVNPLDAPSYASGWAGIVNADVFNINVGGRNAIAARVRTAGNAEISSGRFVVEPNEILEVRISMLKRQARGMVYLGMNAWSAESGGVEVPVTGIYQRVTHTGQHGNPYWTYFGTANDNNTLPVDAWWDITVYLMGSDVPPDQCPPAKIGNSRNRAGEINVTHPWVTFMMDGIRLPVGSRHASIRFLNYYNNGVQTDMHVNHVSVKRIDNQSTAAVEGEQTARVAGDQANASSIQTVSTTVNGHTTSINTLTSSVNGISGQWVLQLDSGGRISGIRLAGSPTFSSLVFLVDQFSIGFPGWPTVVPFTFGTVNGVPTLGITGNVVVDGTIITRHLIAQAITSPKIADRAVTRIAQGANFSIGMGIGQNVFSTTFMDIQDGAIGSPPSIPIQVSWAVQITHSVNQDPANAFQVWLEYLPPGSGSWAILDGPYLPNSRNFLGEVYPGFQRMALLATTARGSFGFRIVVQQTSGVGYTVASALIQARADMK